MRAARRSAAVWVLLLALTTVGVGAAIGSPLPVWSAGSHPHGLALTNDAKTVLVVNTGGAYLGAIDTSTGVQRRNSTQSFAAPQEVAVSPDGSTAYVTSVVVANNTGFVIPVRVSDLFNSTPIQVGSNPWPIVVSPNGTTVYVGNRDSNTVSIIDTGSGSVVKTVYVGIDPLALAASPEGDDLYVADRGSDLVSDISTGSQAVVKGINVGDGPQGIAVTKNGKFVVTANFNDATLSVIDRASGKVVTFAVGGRPFGIAVGRDSNTAYVVNGDSSNTVSIVDLAASKVVGSVKLPGQPWGVVASTKDDRVYVTLSGGSVAAIAYPYASAPSDQTVAAGKTVTFASTVTNKPDSMSWQLSADGGNSWHDLTNGGGTTVSFTASTAESGNIYRLLLHDANYGDSASRTAKLTVTGTDPASGASSGSGTAQGSNGPVPGSTGNAGGLSSDAPTSTPETVASTSPSGANQGLLIVLFVGGLILLLAVAALVVVLLRRAPTKP